MTVLGECGVEAPECGAQTQTLFDEQLDPAGQVAQVSVPPQPSAIAPHWPGLHVFLVQQTLFEQVCPYGQLPQSSVPPQPSLMLLHWPEAQEVLGVQQAPPYSFCPVGHAQLPA